MARTRQRVRTSTPASRRVVLHKKQREEEQYTVRFGVCGKCLVSLRKWGEGGSNGIYCPPCTGTAILKDLEIRRAQPKRLALFVPAIGGEGDARIVDLKETPAYKLIGRTTCNMPRNPEFMGVKALPEYPLYKGYMSDFAAVEYRGRNPGAIAVANAMHVFTSNRSSGPVVFSGPCGLSLLPKEAERFLKIAQEF